jgi:molecular chaperone DnaJ
MALKKDYYEVLGVPRTADDKEIKKAYRNLARKHHPDVNKGDKASEERFKEISAAFAVLSDPDKRATYDRGGHAAFGEGFDPFAGVDFQSFGFGDLSSLFDLFGGGGRAHGRGGRRAHRGNDLRMEMKISFLDAIQGATLRLKLPRRVSCAVCGGSGHAGPRPCSSCRGQGVTATEETVSVRVPAGVSDGSTLRLVGKGDAGRGGGPPGNLLLVLNVEAHPKFRRDGRDLVCDLPVGLARAALGGRVEVQTLDGSATITVPQGTRSGQRFRLKGRGVPANGRVPAGDLYAVIQIHPPKHLDDRSRELLQEFEKHNPDPG